MELLTELKRAITIFKELARSREARNKPHEMFQGDYYNRKGDQVYRQFIIFAT